MDKLVGLLKSTRIIALISAVLASVFKDKLGLTEQQVTEIVTVVVAWIGGESWRQSFPEGATYAEKLKAIVMSKRFWAMAASVAVTVLREKTGLPPDQITNIVYLIGTFIVGESVRTSEQKSP